MAAASTSKRTIYAALIGNLLVAVSKFVAAVSTGSSAMLSEGVHSLVDTTNELLLLFGIHRSARSPDPAHPFGYGRELYFWSFIVALLIFSLGAGLSFYEGISHVWSPAAADDITVNFVVLGLAAVFEGYSWWVARRGVKLRKGKLGYLAAARRSKDPTEFIVFFEDSAALAGIAVAAAGIGIAHLTGQPEWDGIASMVIGLILAATAGFLARESKGLLIGEPAAPALERAILAIADSQEAVDRANGVITVHLAPDQVIAALSAEFRDEATAPQIERCILAIECRICADYPQVTKLFVKPERFSDWRESPQAQRLAAQSPAAGSS